MLLNDDDEDAHNGEDDQDISSAATGSDVMAETTAKMTMATIPSTMMGTRGRNDERRYKRKENFRTMMTMLTTL